MSLKQSHFIFLLGLLLLVANHSASASQQDAVPTPEVEVFNQGAIKELRSQISALRSELTIATKQIDVSKSSSEKIQLQTDGLLKLERLDALLKANPQAMTSDIAKFLERTKISIQSSTIVDGDGTLVPKPESKPKPPSYCKNPASKDLPECKVEDK